MCSAHVAPEQVIPPMNDSSAFPSAWQPALHHSRFLRQWLEAHPELVDWLAERWQQALPAQSLPGILDDLAAHTPIADETTLKRVLRQLRQRVMALLALRDLGGLASLAEVVETMTKLADFTINHALDHLHRQLVTSYGEPLDKRGQPQRLLVVGMGKLGGRELNVSSDIDLIFIYPEDGETAGSPGKGRRIDVYEFFVRLGKRLIATLDEITEDGQVFRVDMRLRPNGESGPLVGSIVSLENYLIAQGREWERYAWIKARVVNEGGNRQDEWVTTLRKVVHPFVYRKYLDFGTIDAMRDLHAQIRREVLRKDKVDHIKLGPGGIREIEFIAQVFQLIRGGRDSALQIRPTLKVLPLLVERRLLTPESGQELIRAYDFLRRLEHRLQYVDDAQTHRLPTAEAERQQIAVSMNFTEWSALLAVLDAHRHCVAHHFEAVFSDPDEGAHPLVGLWLEQIDADEALETVSNLGFRQAKMMLERLHGFRQGTKYQQIPAINRERLDALGPRLIAAAAAKSNPDVTWMRSLDFLETILRRGAYLALLQQYPHLLGKLAGIVESSAWAARYLTQHPILLDEVLDPGLYDIATDMVGFRTGMQQRLTDVAGDTEREMDVMREAHHAQVFRLLAQDIAGLQTLERLADHLTELADIVVETSLNLCWEKLKTRHPQPDQPPKLAVIAYGKLGGKELGYGSDLDLVFLHDDPETDSVDAYTRLVRRMGNWLSTRTSAGQLFETDYRLRPNGDAGILVNSFDAFRDYLLEKAWVFEHQALTRARFCAGNPALGARFEALRIEILRQPRPLEKLKADVLAMRQRMLEAHATNSRDAFDIKHDPGGLVDVEFVVQYLVLGHAHVHERLCGNLGNIALLRIAAELALIPAELAEPVRDIYREYRRTQHAFRLEGTTSNRVDRDACTRQIAQVRRLWDKVFG